MAPILKRSSIEKDSANKKLKQTRRPKNGISSSDLDSSFANDLVTDDSFDDDICPLEVEPSKEFTKSIVFTSSLTEAVNTSIIKGRKRSLKNISVEASPLIPINDDYSELVDNNTSNNDQQDKQSNKISNKSSGELEDQELSIIKSMSLDEIKDHVKTCIQLSSENKINSKNAFALKLIDCMSIVTRSDDNNFIAMACQLDAGAKIYSTRVDVVHQQVMKLMDSCMLAEVRGKKKKGDNEEDVSDDDDDDGEKDNPASKERVKRRKKHMLATSSQISRLPKQPNPREQFVSLQALPGDIMDKAQRNYKDLSLTLDKHIPFWIDHGKTSTCADGFNEIPHIVLKNRKLGPDLDLACKINISSIAKIEPTDTTLDNDYDWNADEGEDYDNEEEFKECLAKESEQKEVKCDAEVVVLAKSRMANQGSSSNISRVDVMNALFHKEGESEYHYLKMENSLYWAGPSYWKRPLGVVRQQENKKKTVRKKKEPQVIQYSEPQKYSLKDPGILKSNRTNRLAKKTMMKWSKKKVTHPSDIHFKPQSIITLYNIKIMVSDMGQNEIGDNLLSEVASAPKEDLEDDYGDNGADDLDDSGSQYKSGDQGAGIDMEGEDVQAPPQGDGTCSESGTGSFAGFDNPGPSNTSDESIETETKAPQDGDAYEGDNLVPMVKMVKVNPIRCIVKPQRIDMTHLKAVVLDIIVNSIEECDQGMLKDGDTRLQGYVTLGDMYRRLKASDQLKSPTKDDLTFQITFFCLLTLTNENSFYLGNNQNGEIVIKKKPDEGDLNGDLVSALPFTSNVCK